MPIDNTTVTLNTAMDAFIAFAEGKPHYQHGRMCRENAKKLLGEELGVLNHTLSEVKITKESFRDVFRTYRSDRKNHLANFYRDAFTYINEVYGVQLDVDAIPSDLPVTKFETQIQIIKILHNSEKSVQEISDEVCLSQRSIFKYLSEMVSDAQAEGFFIGGKKVGVKLNPKNEKYGLSETVHPLLLTPNLMQVILLIRSLFQEYQQTESRMIEDIVRNIWAQLSEYAKERIAEIGAFFAFPIEWVEHIGKKVGGEPYKTELDYICEDEKAKKFDYMHIFKQGKKVEVAYNGENGLESVEGMIDQPPFRDHNAIVISARTHKMEIHFSDIVDIHIK